MGIFGVGKGFYTKSGEIVFGEGLPPPSGGGDFARILRAGTDLEYRMTAGDRHHFTNANVEVQRELRVNQKTTLIGEAELQNSLTVTGATTMNNSLTVNNTIFASGTITSSDERLKENFNPLVGSLEKILKVETYSFNWQNRLRGNQVEIGVKAQQIQKLFPELVRVNKAGYLFVNYQGLIAPVIQAIQEQQKEMDRLKAEMVELKKAFKK